MRCWFWAMFSFFGRPCIGVKLHTFEKIFDIFHSGVIWEISNIDLAWTIFTHLYKLKFKDHNSPLEIVFTAVGKEQKRNRSIRILRCHVIRPSVTCVASKHILCRQMACRQMHVYNYVGWHMAYSKNMKWQRPYTILRTWIEHDNWGHSRSRGIITWCNSRWHHWAVINF